MIPGQQVAWLQEDWWLEKNSSNDQKRGASRIGSRMVKRTEVFPEQETECLREQRCFQNRKQNGCKNRGASSIVNRMVTRMVQQMVKKSFVIQALQLQYSHNTIVYSQISKYCFKLCLLHFLSDLRFRSLKKGGGGTWALAHLLKYK